MVLFYYIQENPALPASNTHQTFIQTSQLSHYRLCKSVSVKPQTINDQQMYKCSIDILYKKLCLAMPLIMQSPILLSFSATFLSPPALFRPMPINIGT